MNVQNLICTVGTSLFYPGLEELLKKFKEKPENLTELETQLAIYYEKKDWKNLSKNLLNVELHNQIAGAEINSIRSMLELGYANKNCNLFFCYSATELGKIITNILTDYYEIKGHKVKSFEIKDLQNKIPKRFRTHGLRNLAKVICKIIRDYAPSSCGINATGGYKAQIAIAVLLGQAIGVPVYYKHESFDEIIHFPPMPVSMDFELWMKASGMLYELDSNEQILEREYKDELKDERYESLIERTTEKGTQYIRLSATGQIFHETFHGRFKSNLDETLPPLAIKKQTPIIEASGHIKSMKGLKEFMEKVTEKIPQVIRCITYNYNPNLPGKIRFKLGNKGIEAIYSDGSATAKIRVDTTAKTDGQKNALYAFMNGWLASEHL